MKNFRSKIFSKAQQVVNLTQGPQSQTVLPSTLTDQFYLISICSDRQCDVISPLRVDHFDRRNIFRFSKTDY